MPDRLNPHKSPCLSPYLSYGRRAGRALKPAFRRLLDARLPSLSLSLPPAGQFLRPASCFPHPLAHICLEIGFGAGEHLLHQATRQRDAGFIGAEIWRPGLAKLMRHLPLSLEPRIRIFPNPASALLGVLAPASLDAIYLLFPDPWPKRGHANRRFCHEDNLAHMARALKPNGRLFLASDHPAVTAQMLQASAKPNSPWQWQAIQQDNIHPRAWNMPWPTYAPTRYDLKARQQKRRPSYLVFLRRA